MSLASTLKPYSGLLDSKVSNKEHLNHMKDIQNVELLWYGHYSTMRVFHPVPIEFNPWNKMSARLHDSLCSSQNDLHHRDL